FGGGGGGITLYTCTDDGRNVRQLASVAPTTPSEGDEDTPRGRGGFGRGGVSNLRVTRDGRSVFYQQGNYVYSATIGGGGGGGGCAGATGGRGFGGRGGGGPPAPAPAAPSDSSAASGGGSSRRVNFNVTLTIDKPAEWKEMFGDAWRTMKYRFYDPK